MKNSLFTFIALVGLVITLGGCSKDKKRMDLIILLRPFMELGELRTLSKKMGQCLT